MSEVPVAVGRLSGAWVRQVLVEVYPEGVVRRALLDHFAALLVSKRSSKGAKGRLARRLYGVLLKLQRRGLISQEGGMVQFVWDGAGQGKIRLSIIGSAALMLQAPYERGTKDGDILEAANLTPEIKERLLRLAGPETTLHRKHRVYLEIVARGIPFLPQDRLFHPVEDLNRSLSHLEIEVLDVVDVVVSKLKRFSANDVSDIEAMVDLELVDHARLIERFRDAVETYAMDARAEDLPRYVRNLHRIERDCFQVGETPIQLPSWIEDHE